MGVLMLPGCSEVKEYNRELDKLQDILDCYKYQAIDEKLIFMCGQEVNKMFDHWFACGYLFKQQYPLISVDEQTPNSIDIDLSYLEELVIPKYRHLFGFENKEE